MLDVKFLMHTHVKAKLLNSRNFHMLVVCKYIKRVSDETI